MEWMFLPLKRYAEFSGRSRRMEYWMFALFQFLLGVVFSILLSVVGGAMAMVGGAESILAAGGLVAVLAGVYALVMLGLIVPALAVGVRRLHDTNRSGWWLLAPLAPYLLAIIGITMAASGNTSGVGTILMFLGIFGAFAMAIALFVFMLLEGTRGPNRFGPDPKQPGHEEVFA